MIVKKNQEYKLVQPDLALPEITMAKTIKHAFVQNTLAKSTRGQALPLGIAFILFCILITLVLFNTGQLVSVKSRLANTADSAVYSGLIWQSRALNFQSYTNRAMVANQVTIAQAISLRAWSLYGKIAAENVDTVLGSIPYIGLISGAMEVVMNSTANLVQPLSTALLSFVNSINGVLSTSQSAMYAAAFVATPEIVRSVTRKNDRSFTADTVFSVSHAGLNLDQWQEFTQQYGIDDDSAMSRRAQLINQSRDAFTSNRDWEFFNQWFYIAPFVKVKMHKRGETRLLASTDEVGSENRSWEWKGKDTLSFNTRIWRPIKSDKKIELPIGWGQALVNQKSTTATSESSCQSGSAQFEKNKLGKTIGNDAGSRNSTELKCDRWFDYNRSGEYMSDNNIRSLAGTESREKMDAHYAGIQAYRDLANLGAQDVDPRLRLRIEVESNINATDTTSNLGIADKFLLNDFVASRSLASIASGEVYFKKPLRDDQNDHIEHANAYNPFWDTRLIATPDDVRAQALLLRGVPLPELSIQSDIATDSSSDGASSLQLVQYQTDQSLGELSSSYPTTGKFNKPASVIAAAEQDLKGAVTGLVVGALSGYSGPIDDVNISLEHAYLTANSAYETQLEAVDADPSQYGEVAQLAESETNFLQDEFEQIKKAVSNLYEQAVLEIELVAQTQLDELSQQILVVKENIAAAVSDQQKTELEAVLLELKTEYEAMVNQQTIMKAEALMEIVNNSTSLYQMEFATALEIVSLGGDIGESIEQVLRVSCGDEALDADDAVYIKDEDCEEE